MCLFILPFQIALNKSKPKLDQSVLACWLCTAGMFLVTSVQTYEGCSYAPSIHLKEAGVLIDSTACIISKQSKGGGDWCCCLLFLGSFVILILSEKPRGKQLISLCLSENQSWAVLVPLTPQLVWCEKEVKISPLENDTFPGTVWRKCSARCIKPLVENDNLKAFCSFSAY